VQQNHREAIKADDGSTLESSTSFIVFPWTLVNWT